MSRPKHASRMPFALLVGGLVVGGMCALLALNTASAANELSRHDLAQKDARVAAQLVQLQNEVAASAAPGNLASVAAQLGMVPDGNPAFLQIDANGAVRVLGSPAPATSMPLAAPSRHAKKPKSSTSAKSSATAKSGATAKSSATNKTTTAAKSSPASQPTPTPTPNTTLPGGTR